jgi:hypothetical protein
VTASNRVAGGSEVASRTRIAPRLILTVVVTALSAAAPVTAQQDAISQSAKTQIDALVAAKASRTPAQQKINSRLLFALKMARGEPIAAGIRRLNINLPDVNARGAVVDLRVEVSQALLDQLARLGAEVIEVNSMYRHVRIRVTLNELETIAALPQVSSIQPKQEALIQRGPVVTASLQQPLDSPPITNVGSRMSEGDWKHRANIARSTYGVDGTGVKIGVLSDGVSSLSSSQSLGDLGPVTVLAGQTGTGDEGTAMLEIIHDIAPGAQLYFATAFTSMASFAQNIRNLRAAGCDIIVDDVGYSVETPFQDGQITTSATNGGIVIQAVKDVTADGALYFSSAGNSGNKNDGTSGTWEGDFVDGGAASGPLAGAGRVHNFGGQTYDVVTAASGNPITLFWSDPLGASSNDYDIYRLDSTGTVVVDASDSVQSGTQDPFEIMGQGFANDRIVIVKFAGSARFLHLDTNRGRLSISTQGETHGHNATSAANSFGVAATSAQINGLNPFNSSHAVEAFSSDGPRRIFFQGNGAAITPGNLLASGGQLLQKPDLTAADGVSVTGVGGFSSPFFGTSAAAPHAAAIAALIKSRNTGLTASQIRSALLSGAIDIESAGVDRDSGSGIIMADTALAATPPPAVITAVSATPNSGAGLSQSFALAYSDTVGASDLQQTWVWFNATFASSSANSCMIYYTRATNTLNLLNDAGSAWQSAALGAATTVQNTQCAVNVGSSSASLSGNSLTLTLAMTFKGPFAGAKNIYMYADNLFGASSGWQDRGDWTVAAPAIVTADAATPNAGMGTTQTFALAYSDSAGATDVSQLWVWINATFAPSAANSCMLYYVRATNTLNLLNDAGVSWESMVLGGGGTLQNSQCAIALGGTMATPTGNTLTLTLAVTFKPAFAGAKNIYMYAQNATGASSGWQDRGDWTVPAAPTPIVTADSSTPGTGTGATQTFAMAYSDSAGATDLSQLWVWINATFAPSAANSCMLYYVRATNTLNLLDDAGASWQSAVLGGGGTLQNSQCSVALGSSMATPTGNTLTLTLAVTFKPAFAGAKNIYMYAQNATGASSGWQDRGDWTVPAGPTAIVTADSSTPGTGTGGTQTFAMAYSDSAGAADLSQLWVWINATFAPSAANSCMLYYVRATNTLNLLNDAGVSWESMVLGGGGTLQNRQCAIALGGSTATPTANTLTLSLALTFKTAFAGAKNLYMYAQNDTGASSGWQDRGDWTVPSTVSTVTADSVTPNAGSGSTQTFALLFSDTAGGVNLTQAWVWFNATFASSAANSCMAYYDKSTNEIYLINDAGTAWLPGTLGTSATLQNASCVFALGSSSISVSGNILTLTLATTFKPAFTGAKNIYMYAANAAKNSGWQTRGSWMVP